MNAIKLLIAIIAPLLIVVAVLYALSLWPQGQLWVRAVRKHGDAHASGFDLSKIPGRTLASQIEPERKFAAAFHFATGGICARYDLSQLGTMFEPQGR